MTSGSRRPNRTRTTRPGSRAEAAVTRAGPSTGMVVAPQPEAAEAGAEVLRAGGGAVDAAVAAALVQGVVDPLQCGLGGFGSMAIHDAKTGALSYVDFHARAPQGAHPEMWQDR